MSEYVQRSPTFTLGTALMWLGHECRGHCPLDFVQRRANVSFLHLPDHMIAIWNRTLVEVEFGNDTLPAGNRAEALSQVNRCVRADHLRVRERTAVERALFFAALVARGRPIE
ncbi:MAG: hypothetical protein ABJA94_10385 [Rhodoglobus sp.]